MVNTQLTGGFISKQGWITNKAEPDAFHYNNIYGFGVIDANKAVEMALKYSKEDTEKLGQFISHTFNFSGNITIPDNKSSGATVRSVNSKEMIAEEVQVKLSIEHANSSDLAIWLKSPKGTSHQVIPRGSKTNGNYVNILFTSNAFYGEEAKGEWEIKAVDGNAGEAGHLSSASIIIYGHTK
jgi:subtilisin-like proprotein convertase family protein